MPFQFCNKSFRSIRQEKFYLLGKSSGSRENSINSLECLQESESQHRRSNNMVDRGLSVDISNVPLLSSRRPAVFNMMFQSYGICVLHYDSWKVGKNWCAFG